MLDGNLKSLGLFWANLASNQRYETYVQEEDISTFWRRLSNEGLTFLTVVLPRIGKALDSFHSTSEWEAPSGFETRNAISSDLDSTEQDKNLLPILPLFLGNAVEAAMNGDSIAVDCVRQLTLVFYKLEVDYGEIGRASCRERV